MFQNLPVANPVVQGKTSFGDPIDEFTVEETGTKVYVYRNQAGGFTFTHTEIGYDETVAFDDVLTSIFTMKAVMRYYEGLNKIEQPCSANSAY